jgi:RecA-family ATPase
VSPRSLELKGINSISPREFIYHKWLMKGAITILIAPGARGKSSLVLSQAIDISCGVDRLGAKLARPRSVFLYNAEDSIPELERRAEAYMVLQNFTDEQKQMVQKNLHIQSGADGMFLFATQDRSDVVTNEPLVKSLVEYILLHKIELVTLHNVQENDNTGMTQVADVFKRIVSATNVAMLIAHHSRKVQRGSTALDANDGRGAVAVINSARIVMNINDVGSPAKAAEFQITDDLWRYIIVSTGDKCRA